jgi:uncharacterized membrane protein YdjX (TVP38/TMEM64 family)
MTDTAEPELPVARKPIWQRLLPVAIIIGGLVAAYAAGLHRYLSLETLAERRADLLAFTEANLVAAVALFVGAYILVAAFSIPGGIFLTLTGGFLFGQWIGTTATVVGATIGATILFVMAKSAFGDILRARASGFLEKLRAGFEENAFNYLLTLRLIPAFPFVVVNIAPAFLGVKLRDYVLATFLGIIPGTFVYTSIGVGLGKTLDAGGEPTLSLLAQPEILVALIGLGLLSLLPVVFNHFKKRSLPNEG